MNVDNIFYHIFYACVEFCFLKKEFLNLTITMTIDQLSFSQAPSACVIQSSIERLVYALNEFKVTFIPNYKITRIICGYNIC